MKDFAKSQVVSTFIIVFLCLSGSLGLKAQHTTGDDLQSFINKIKSHESNYFQWHDHYIKSLEPLSQQNNHAEINSYDYTLDTVKLYSANANPKKFIYTYNEDLDREQTLTHVFENEIWTNFSKQNFTYEDGILVKIIWQAWENDSWQNVSQTEYEYSGSGKVLEFVKKNWESGAWENAISGDYTYDASDNLVAYLEEIWEDDEWTNYSHELYTYDSVSNLLTAFGEIWDDSLWVNDQRHTYTYDQSGNQITALSENWQEGTWMYLYKENNEYNENNQLISSTAELWNDSLWIYDQYIEYTYNDLDYLTSKMLMIWQDDDWVNHSISENTYNNYGSIETSLMLHWVDNEWANYEMSVNAYDENGNALQGNFYTWDNGNWSQTADGIISLPYNHGLHMESYAGYRADADYTYLYVALEESFAKEQLQMDILSNPVSDQQLEIQIDLNQNAHCMAGIYDSRGNLICNASYSGLAVGQNRILIDLSGIPGGMYFLVFSNGNQQNSEKFIIK